MFRVGGSCNFPILCAHFLSKLVNERFSYINHIHQKCISSVLLKPCLKQPLAVVNEYYIGKVINVYKIYQAVVFDADKLGFTFVKPSLRPLKIILQKQISATVKYKYFIIYHLYESPEGTWGFSKKAISKSLYRILQSVLTH